MRITLLLFCGLCMGLMNTTTNTNTFRIYYQYQCQLYCDYPLARWAAITSTYYCKYDFFLFLTIENIEENKPSVTNYAIVFPSPYLLVFGTLNKKKTKHTQTHSRIPLFHQTCNRTRSCIVYWIIIDYSCANRLCLPNTNRALPGRKQTMCYRYNITLLRNASNKTKKTQNVLLPFGNNRKTKP